MHDQRGTTLFELMLTISLVALLSGITMPVLQSFQISNAIDNTTYDAVTALRRAHERARALEGDSEWGVFIDSDEITVFKGDDYSERDEDYDQLYDMPGSVTPSGLSEIFFNKETGVPNTTGTITLTSTTNEVHTVTINEKGMVDY